jgi:exodeoxyribonuclease V beta subunit
MARDLHALLRSMVHREGDPAPRLAVLLTHFFNRQPETIEPDKDLEPCHSPGTCGNGASCIAHALQEWISLADRQRWAQLFRSVQERTGIRERLIALVDGERHLADLRQVIDYCIEKLCRGNFSLNQLVEHLKRLLDNEESVGQDENLHVLATDKSSVRVLTMHAAKGLEFKVVFVVNRAPTLRSPLVWIGEDQKKTVMPALSISQEARNSNSKLNAAYINVEKQKSQERRRLMYVALTRAQAMLFVPMHFGNKGKADDNDLTPRLQHLLAAGKNSNVKQFDPEEWRSTKPHNTADADDVDLCVRVEKIPDICNLKLPSRICRQTSYTQLSRYASGKQDTDPEYDDDDDPTEQAAPQETRQLPALPGGKQTGDALHLAIEELLGKEDINTLINDVAAFRALIEKHLENNGILRQIAKRKKPGKTKDDAVLAAVEFVRGALTTEISLPAGGGVKIVDLQKTDRIPEMEFMLGADPHWIHGFMDLVFRVPEKSAGHPWRYYVLDWKSDQAEKYELEHIEKAMSDRHYDLQARLYNHALDKYLKGILGDVYDPARNLGGAIYVFLRSFQRDLGAGQCHFVIRRADPVQDAQYTADRISDLIGKGSS